MFVQLFVYTWHFPSSFSCTKVPKMDVEPRTSTSTGTDKDGNKSEGSESESEENTGGIRMMTFLNRYKAPTNSPQRALPKGKAKAKASSATVKQHNRSTGPIAPKPKNTAAKTTSEKTEKTKNGKESKPHKTVVGNAGF